MLQPDHRTWKEALALSPALTWMQYPSSRWGGSGYLQFAFRFWGLPLTVIRRGATKPLSWPVKSCEFVSKQLSAVPRLPELKVLPSATLERIGVHRAEQGVARPGRERQ